MKCVVELVPNNCEPGKPVEIREIILWKGNGESQILSSTNELVKVLSTIETPILFVRNLHQMFCFIEPALLAAGLMPQMCQDHGKGFHVWTHSLKPNQYAPVIKGNMKRECSMVKFSNFKMYDADPWLGNIRTPLTLLTSDEVNYLLALSEMALLKTTPSGQAWSNFSIAEPHYNDLETYINIQSGVRGGIIQGKKGFYKVAYHYDVTSMYPHILASINRMPWYAAAEKIKESEKADHDHYAYWVPPFYYCDVTSEMMPADTIKMPLVVPNSYATPALQLYQAKACARKGTLQHTVAKLMVNSFIGRIIMRADKNTYFKYCDRSYLEKVMPNFNDSTQRHYEVYTYVIALARKRIKQLMNQAIAEGCRIIQVNTDGFFTDKPISFADSYVSLGSLRFEYEAHNLTIFACNQYACDEEVCIAGLPKGLYVPGQTYYEFPIMVSENGQLVWEMKSITLGAGEEEEDGSSEELLVVSHSSAPTSAPRRSIKEYEKR